MVAGMLALAALAQIWTVDDDGPADFPSLQAAIDAAAPGDLLLVHPGSYGDVSASIELSVVAASGARFTVGSFGVTGAPSFRLVGATVLEYLSVQDASGHVVVDGCSVGGATGPATSCATGNLPYIGGAWFTNCALLEVDRCSFRGGVGAYPDQTASAAVVLTDCVASFVDCRFVGGAAEVCGDGHPAAGAPGIVLEGASQAFVAGTSAIGGDGNPTGLALGTGAAGVRVDGSSAVDVRGSTAQSLVGGLSQSSFPPTSFQAPAIELLASGSASVSGVGVSPAVLPPGVVVPVPSLPWIRFAGSDAPGGVATLEAFGPAGTGTVGALAVAAFGPLSGLGLGPEPLWLNPAKVFALFGKTLVGPDLPAQTSWAIPTDPSLAGCFVIAQVFALTGHLTNPAALVVRW